MPSERELAQLWAIYFSIKALRRPPECLRQAAKGLDEILDGGQPADLPPELQLVKSS
jgi:hypothetical protein